MTAILLVGALAAFGWAAAAGDDAEITVDFSDDGLSFNVTSTKDISHIEVAFCDGTSHKHDGLDGLTYSHTETAVVATVWVKSGANSEEGPGSGERFENDAADCDGGDDEEDCVDDVATVVDECATGGGDDTGGDDEDSGDDDEEETEVPFFPGFNALALGSLGAVAVVGLALRRRG